MTSPNHLIYNARIYSNKNLSNTWMVFDKNSGIIKSLGSGSTPTGFSEKDKTDCQGHLVLPGLHDSHLHMLWYGQKMSQIDLSKCSSIDQLKQQLVSYCRNNPEAKWLEGYGWDQNLLGRYPLAEDLDEVCGNVPVFLKRVCHHAAVINQTLLNLLANIDEYKTSDLIERYPIDHSTKAGKPTGIIKENMLSTISKHKPPASKEERLKHIKRAMQDLLEAGVTSAHPCELDTWHEFCHLYDTQQLPIRIFYCTYGIPPKLSDAQRGNMLCFNRVKFFADGSLGAQTAALSMPHLIDKDRRTNDRQGNLLLDDIKKKEMEERMKEGYRVEVHVIGDLAAEEALKVLHRVPGTFRPVFIHCQVLRRDLIKQMKAASVIAIVQPQFVNSDGRWLNETLPKELQECSYAWKTLIDEGVIVVGSSDAPIEEPVPFLGIFDCVYRLVGARDHVNNKLVYKPEECLDIHQALDMYTKWGAYAAGKEDQLGSLTPGMLADFVVVDKDVISSPCVASILQTWVGGVRRYCRADC